MKKIYVVFAVTLDGKHYALADSISAGENLLAHCARYNTNTCHLCESKRQAVEIAAHWNESYRRNGTNLY